MAFDIRLRMIVFTMSTSHGTVIGPGMSYSTAMFLTCATRSDILLAKTTTSEMSTSWNTVFMRPIWLFVHLSRLSSSMKVLSVMLLPIVIISMLSSPICSCVRFIESMLKTIFNVPIGDRRSWAITEYILSRASTVACNSSRCRMIVRCAAAR